MRGGENPLTTGVKQDLPYRAPVARPGICRFPRNKIKKTVFVLLSTACPTSLASEPNIRGGRSGVQTAPACGAAFGGIDNDQPEIKARQRHRARLDPKPRYPSKDFHHKEIAKKLRDGFRGLREKRKEPIHNFKGNTEGNSYVPVDLYFKCSGRAALNFFCLTDT